MKFLSIALFAVGVTAQSTIEPSADAPAPSATGSSGSGSSSCDADYIVERCLSTENDKVEACDSTDYDCQCAAYEAVATCYNNCPEDPRAAPANNQVKIFCQQASLYGTKTKSHNSSSTGTETLATAAPTTTSDDDDEDEPQGSNTATFDANVPTESDGAGIVFVNAGGALVAVAGAIAALL